MAGITLENSGGFGSEQNGSPWTIAGAIGFTPTVGRKLIMAVSGFVKNLDRVTQPGVVWTQVAIDSQVAADPLGVSGTLWHGDVVGPTPTDTITIQGAGTGAGNSIGVAVHELSGIRGFWPLESTATANGSATPVDSGNAGLNVSPDAYLFAVALMASGDPTKAPGAPTNGYTAREEHIGTDTNLNGKHRAASADKIVAVASTAQTTWAYAGFDRWVGVSGIWARDDAPGTDITFRQQKEASGTAVASLSVTLDFLPLIADTLVLAISLSGGKLVQSVSQGNGNWVRLAQRTHTNGNVTTEIWYTKSLGFGAADKVVVNATGTCDMVASCQEYRDVLKSAVADPVEQVVTDEGSNDPMGTGQTAAVASKGSLLFAALSHADPTADQQNAPEFLRMHQLSEAALSGASWANINPTASLQYEVEAEAGTTGDWTGAMVVLRSGLQPLDSEAMAAYSAESGQGGTDTSAPAVVANIPAGSFVDGHRHLILASMRLSTQFAAFAQPELKVGGVVKDEGFFQPQTSGTGLYQTFAAARVETLTASQGVTLELDSAGYTARQANLVALDLDSPGFLPDRDWFAAESDTLLAEMDSTFANNTGAELTFNADGTSAYLVVMHARLQCDVGASLNAEAVAQLWDDTNSQELIKLGWIYGLNLGNRMQSGVGVCVVQPPGTFSLKVRCVGGSSGSDGWDHVRSSITVLRLDQFLASGYDQNLALNQAGPGDTMPPTGGAVAAQASFTFEPDVLGEMITLAYTEADNSADETEGIASQAQYPNIAGGDRSLYDSEDTTLGGVVAQKEQNVGRVDVASVDVRAPTFGVSRRTGVVPTPATVSWYNAGLTGNASVVSRVCIACFGRQLQPIPVQTPPPDPVTPPSSEQRITIKADGVHEAEALDNLLEQFKP